MYREQNGFTTEQCGLHPYERDYSRQTETFKHVIIVCICETDDLNI